MQTVTVIGSYVSPYVRKVLVVLDLKGVPYRIDPIVPFFGGEAFTALSPLRRIPVLIHGEVTLCDSTVICEYLDEIWPSPAVYPEAPAARARARWLEEYADTRMGEVLIWHYFNQLVIRPAVTHRGAAAAYEDRRRAPGAARGRRAADRDHRGCGATAARHHADLTTGYTERGVGWVCTGPIP